MYYYRKSKIGKNSKINFSIKVKLKKNINTFFLTKMNMNNKQFCNM